MSLSQEGWSQDLYKTFGGLAYRNYLDGNFEDAIIYANRLIRDYPDSTFPYIILGGSYHSMENLDGAVKNYSKALELGDSSVLVLDRRAAAYTQLNQYALAEADFKSSVRLFPSDMGVKLNLARCYYLQSRFDEIVLMLDTVVSFSDEYNVGYFIRGFAKQSLGRYESAILDYKERIEKDSTNHQLYLHIAECYKALGRTTEMCETLRDCYERTYIGSNEYFAGDCVRILDHYINPPPEYIPSEDILPPPQEVIKE